MVESKQNTPEVEAPCTISSDKSNDLYSIINSKDFELFHCISYLQQYKDNVGIQYYICKRLISYPFTELRFYVPQFLQLLITVETQSMALEEMIKDLCTKDAHFSLITFWHLQAMLQDLSKEPESIGFQICKRLVNELQYQLFNYSNSQKTSSSSLVASSGLVAKHEMSKRFKPNVVPSIILATSLLAGATVPESTRYVEPIVKIQGKQIKSMVFEVVKDVKKNLTENLTKKNTLNNAMLGRTKQEYFDFKRSKSVNLSRDMKSESNIIPKNMRKSEELGFEMIDTYADLNLPNLSRPSLKIKKIRSEIYPTHSSGALSSSNTGSLPKEITHKSKSSNNVSDLVQSMPNLRLMPTNDNDDLNNHTESPVNSISDLANAEYVSDGSYASSIRNSFDYRDSSEMDSIFHNESNGAVNNGSSNNNNNNNNNNASTSLPYKIIQNIPLTRYQKVKLLKSNYFKNETQFVIALQNISIRLSKVPKEARLSTLKAELSVLNTDLPCEVDIPMLLPKNKRGKLHKICRIAVNESAVLNSAERVPYLILVEYLSDDVDFDPSSSTNKKLLNHMDEKEEEELNEKKYRFDLAYQNRRSTSNSTPSTAASPKIKEANSNNLDDFEESDLADISVVKLTNRIGNSSGKISIGSILPENSDPDNLSILPLSAANEFEHNIATQLRIASIMLTQLDSPNSILPQLQASQIKTRIIESMQSMQNGFGHVLHNHGAGERKLSNDMKVAGLSYLGEDWKSKKSRIRKESKFGHLENWDLFSMIAKTGDDLSQEAFACQLIHMMANIWYQDRVKVWVKRMRILVTSVNTGLVETITNAVSVHSIKKALEQHILENNEIPNGGIVTLKDHFIRLFGDENTERYKRAQDNFCVSLAAYSVICYILQIKDRHNGNIMFDSEGHIVHIDFGFLLSNSPGSVGFESAPFKLTQEYVDLLGGVDSYYFNKFKQLMKDAFKSLRRNADCIIDMVELMQKDSSLPCFKAGENTSVLLKQRFQLHLTEEEVDSFIENFLINKSLNSAYTRLYDQFQLLTQGIYI